MHPPFDLDGGVWPRLGVDIHVHRVTNRWGYVSTKTPQRPWTPCNGSYPTVRFHVEINRLLVPFGKSSAPAPGRAAPPARRPTCAPAWGATGN
ncbi:MAG: hypothetical protein WBA12_04970, partial [Catalinimonas sp.]